MPLSKPFVSGEPDHLSASTGVLRFEIMRVRKDFLAAARAKRIHTKSFVLQIRDRGDDGAPRVGFTCSKKVGNAVARNKAKRRLREVARLALAPLAESGHDYVLIGRANITASHPFDAMCADITAALRS